MMSPVPPVFIAAIGTRQRARFDQDAAQAARASIDGKISNSA